MQEPDEGVSVNNSTSQDGKSALQHHGKIQKISQEGSKSTYMIILRKDCLSDYQSKNSSQPSFSDRTVQQTLSDWDLDSPDACAVQYNNRRKLRDSSDDVKLNLSNINDEEYDSNKSASSVFLQQDSGVFEPETMLIENKDCSSTLSTEKTHVNAYVIPSPLAIKRAHKPADRYLFPVTSSHQSLSHHPAATSSARKNVLVSSSESNSLLRRPLTFTNDAVPVISKSHQGAFQTPTPLLPTNPKAVPTFSNISPINQLCPSGARKSSFVPICPAESPALKASWSGPITSTPVYNETRGRPHHSRAETAPHCPVYIIPSPFTRPKADTPQTSNISMERRSLDTPSDWTSTTSMNNSSGFVSGSSSLETSDWSKLSEPVADKTSVKEGLSMTIWDKQCSDRSEGVVISIENIAGRDIGLETYSQASSQESTETVEKGSFSR